MVTVLLTGIGVAAFGCAACLVWRSADGSGR